MKTRVSELIEDGVVNNPLQGQAKPLMPYCDGCDATDGECKCEPNCQCDDHCKNRNKDGHASVADDVAQEAISAIESLSSGGVVRQARALKGYLLKFPVEQRAEEGKKWLETKDFTPHEKVSLSSAYSHEVKSEASEYPEAAAIFGNEQVEGAVLSPKLAQALEPHDLGEVDVTDPRVIKILNTFENDILRDMEGAVGVISGNIYEDIPYKWVDLYRGLSKIYNWGA